MPTHAETCASAAFRLQQQQSHRKTARRADQIASEPHLRGARWKFTRPLSTSATLSEAYRPRGDVRGYCVSVPMSRRTVQDTSFGKVTASAPGMRIPRRRPHELSSIAPALGDSCSTCGDVHGYRFALRRHTPAEDSSAYNPGGKQATLARISADLSDISRSLGDSHQQLRAMRRHARVLRLGFRSRGT